MTARSGHRGFRAVNRKAEQKLDFVGKSLMAASGEAEGACPVAVEPLVRILDLQCCPETGPLTMRYRPQSKLFAILYDLVFEFSVGGPRIPGCKIGLAPGSSKLAVVGEGVEGDRALSLSALHDNGLMEDRMRLLGVTQVSAVCDDSSDVWQVAVSPMVGSATWNLVPPIMHLIEPSAAECLRMIELLRLLAVGIRSL